MSALVADMAAHVAELAERNGIVVHHSRRAHAAAEFYEVWFPAVRGTISYATALHEMGHCLGRYQASRSVLVAERWAWRWAKDNALVWTAGMEQSMAGSLRWYREQAPWPPRQMIGPPGCSRAEFDR